MSKIRFICGAIAIDFAVGKKNVNYEMKSENELTIESQMQGELVFIFISLIISLVARANNKYHNANRIIRSALSKAIDRAACTSCDEMLSD